MIIEIKIKSSAELVSGRKIICFILNLKTRCLSVKYKLLRISVFFICTYYRENFVTFGGPSIIPPVGGDGQDAEGVSAQ